MLNGGWRKRQKQSMIPKMDLSPTYAQAPFITGGGYPLHEGQSSIRVDIYVAKHCSICAYAYEIADFIRQEYPAVIVRIIDIEATSEPIPEEVFATPTYMLNGRIWSLGNPSPAQAREKLQLLLESAEKG